VILPLSKELDYEIYAQKYFKLALLNHFQRCDKTTFDRNRFFYFPSQTEHFKTYWQEGEKFNIYKELGKKILEYKEAEEYKEKIEAMKNALRRLKPERPINWDRCRNELIEILKCGENSGRYVKVLSWIGKWKRISDDDTIKIKDILESSGYKNIKSLKNLLR
jgi:hypothetical protein